MVLVDQEFIIILIEVTKSMFNQIKYTAMKKKVNLYDYLTDASAYITNLQALAQERDWAANYVDPASVKVYHVKEDNYLASYEGECA